MHSRSVRLTPTGLSPSTVPLSNGLQLHHTLITPQPASSPATNTPHNPHTATPARFPHSDTPGSTLGCQLPRAYRRLLRPSSALDAKASTTCPSQLVTHTTTPTTNPPHPPHHTPPPHNHPKTG